MFIEPIVPMTSLDMIKSPSTSKESVGEGIFKDFFKDAVQNVVETDAQVAKEVHALVTGQTDDLHNLQIAISKAQLSVDLVVQIRNRFMDSYNEIMRMNV